MPLTLSKIDHMATVAQEFHISATPLGEDEYLVRIERVAPGVPLAEERVRWPVEDWLSQARQLMNDPLMDVLEGNASFLRDSFFSPVEDTSVSPCALNLVALGEQLYDALFQGSLRDSWMMAQAVAQNKGEVLRLRLGLKGTRLPRLPWEVLHADDRPLATGTDVAFSRYQMGTRLMSPVRTLSSASNHNLKILMVIAGPSDQESLELAEEAIHLQEELRRRSPNGPPAIELTILEQPGREQLTQALEQGHYQVFHYAGHSNLGESGGDVHLVSNKTGLTETLNGEDLAGLLVNNGIQLAVFNSCRGAYTAASDDQSSPREGNLAGAMVKRGIPAVLAMAERIPDEVALTLTRLLYRNLNQGYPIDLSLSRARQGLVSAYGSNQLYWALPILYLHSEFHGFLTDIDEAAYNRGEILRLPEPLETSLPINEEEALFTPPAFNPTDFPDIEDDSSMSDLGEYDDESSELEATEADFIRSLLNDLNSESVQNEPEENEPVASSSFEHKPLRKSDFNSGQLAATPSSPPTSLDQESAVTAPVTTNDTASPIKPQSPSESLQTPRLRQSKTSKLWWQKLRSAPQLWIGLGATGIVAFFLLGFWLFQSRQPSPGQLLTQADSSVVDIPALQPSPDLQTADTKTVTAYAIEQFSQGNIVPGGKATEALLERSALPSATAALAAVPKSQLDNPIVSFLRGRLAWQSILTGSKEFQLDDARRYWESALKAQPDSWHYQNALGFAYYAEGKIERANNSWLKALSLIDQAQVEANAKGEEAKREVLTTYAGLALGMWRSAEEQTDQKRTKLLNKSLQLRQKVMTDDPLNFQPEALGKNWLWSEQAIKDWQSLLAMSN
ncbi:MAG: CHAT domain-containing protein [Symploca sp. SIO3C6]|nr:CHAT domain-containing protein [Symploca sp. SIO3C6]